jgi:hypothetical protein
LRIDGKRIPIGGGGVFRASCRRERLRLEEDEHHVPGVLLHLRLKGGEIQRCAVAQGGETTFGIGFLREVAGECEGLFEEGAGLRNLVHHVVGHREVILHGGNLR